MAGTYGEPGKNPFTVKGFGGVLSPVVNSQTGVTQIYRGFQSIGTYNPSTGKFTADKNANLSESDIKSLSSSDSINNIKNAAKSATVKGVIAAGGTEKEAEAQANKLISPNSGADNGGGEDGGNQGGNTDASEDLNKDLNDLREGTRYQKNSFPNNLKYPSNLQVEHQDVIQFNMLSYEKRSLGEPNSPLGSFGERSQYTERTIGRVVLPIPGGISDTNSVEWNTDKLPAAQKALADFASSLITKGGESAGETFEGQLEKAKGASGEIQQGLAAYFTNAAIQSSNLLSRSEGAIQNPNMELLFSGVTLRPFNFTFKLSARGKDDKENITKIIRFFKQGMAAQRTASQLFLKAPNTFKIRYLHKDKDHPYINYIKECALLSFTVNYTPEGNYMTFADGLMTSYEISMQFQELEPIFNDDYSKLPGGNSDTVIGY